MDEFIAELGTAIQGLLLPDQCELIFQEGNLLPNLYFCFKDSSPKRIVECEFDGIRINPIPSTTEAESKEFSNISWRSGIRIGETEAVEHLFDWRDEEQVRDAVQFVMGVLQTALNDGGWMKDPLAIMATINLEETSPSGNVEFLSPELPASEEEVKDWLLSLGVTS